MSESFQELDISLNPIKESIPITVLLVDDQEIVGESLRDMLSDQENISFHFCSDPSKALGIANQINPTVILQDLVMPDIDGLTLVKYFRANPTTKDTPMIVLSSREEPEIKHKAFSLGANDYMVKFPDKLEVVARILYHSKAYINKVERDKAFKALAISQKALKSELEEAENYVKSLLPELLNDEFIKTDSVFISSAILGGDSFGYHWIDPDFFAVYLLDVCGHGVGAALLSISALNALRGQSLPDVDFKDTAAVLTALNNAFDMEKQNGMYFTMWYGVYNKKTQELSYSSGGHPPSVLVQDKKSHRLKTPGMVIGGMPNMKYKSATISIKSNDRLYIFSDGAYEIDYIEKKRMMNFEDFEEKLIEATNGKESKTQAMVEFSRTAQNDHKFEDDYSLVEVTFK